MIEKLTLLNETILDFLNEKNEIKIVKAFTQLGIKILEADFGFVWLKQAEDNKWVLVYKTPNLPFEPNKPRMTGRNDSVMKSRKIEYVKKFKHTPHTSDAGKYMKSFVIIPISFKDKSYGTIVLCFKKKQSFSREKKILGTFLGNGIAQVITIHRLIEGERKTRILEEENLKMKLIIDANHELRTPVAIIKGNLDLVMREENKTIKSQKRSLRAMDNEIKHLSGILSELTLITPEMVSSKERLLYEKVDIKNLVHNILKRCSVLAHKKNISLIAKNVPNCTVDGDRVYIEKMILNLVKNSIVYGKKNGHTKIFLKKSQKRITIIISDDGIGISKEDLPHVFERFYRADKSHKSIGSSTGLGLAIVKWVAEAHGGHVQVKSIENKGSTFSVLIPVKPVNN